MQVNKVGEDKQEGPGGGIELWRLSGRGRRFGVGRGSAFSLSLAGAGFEAVRRRKELFLVRSRTRLCATARSVSSRATGDGGQGSRFPLPLAEICRGRSTFGGHLPEGCLQVVRGEYRGFQV